MKDYSEYSVEDFNRAFMRFYEALTYGKQPVKSPTAFLLGGQGGSGKSSVHELSLIHISEPTRPY